MSGEPHPKPAKRKRKQIREIDAKATTRAVLAHPSCPLCGRPASNGHHILAKGSPHFGDDVAENIVALCGTGTTGCHGLIENEDLWARAALGQHLCAERLDVIEYVQRKLGKVAGAFWLERRLLVRVAA